MKLYAVGISGRMGVGKTTLAVCLRDKLYTSGGVTARVLPIAYKLKREAYNSLRDRKGLPYEIAKKYGWSIDPKEILSKPTTTQARQLLREYGLEGRKSDPYHWAKEWLFEAVINSDVFQVVIADDVRYEEERNLIKAFGFCVFVWRNGVEGDGHTSELLEPDNDKLTFELPPLGSLDYKELVDKLAWKVMEGLVK